MAGNVEDYTPKKIGNIKADIAADSGCNADDISIQVEAGSVVITVVMPSKAASTLQKEVNNGNVKSLGGEGVTGAKVMGAAPTQSPTLPPECQGPYGPIKCGIYVQAEPRSGSAEQYPSIEEPPQRSFREHLEGVWRAMKWLKGKYGWDTARKVLPTTTQQVG